ncbi:TPA: hypothetical protein U1D12_000426 [Streptococcus suis]|nr:hypothetical protein [Streptococcus suis]
MSTISYKPLNLYRQFKSAAQEFPNVTIYFDQPYASFSELGLENTYQTVFEAIQKRAAQFAEAGIVGYGDKVVLYKRPAFDTYLLAVAVTALGAVTYYKEDARFQDNVYGAWWDSCDYGCMTPEGTLLLKDRQVDLIEHIDSSLALEDVLLEKLDFLSEVVIIRDVNGAPQPIIALADDAEMNWEAWWAMVADLPLLKEPILMAYDDIPRTATMKVQRLKMEVEMKEKNL